MYTRLLAHSYTRGILRKHCELVIYFSIPTRNRHLIIFTLYGTGGFQKRRANIPHKRFLQAIYLWPAIPPGAARRHKPKTSRPLANWRYKPGYGAEWHWAPTCQYEYATYSLVVGPRTKFISVLTRHWTTRPLPNGYHTPCLQ